MECCGGACGMSDAPVGASSGVLETVDRELEPFVALLGAAVQNDEPRVVLQYWRRARYLCLLPSHVQLRWPGRNGLAPNARIGFVPLSQSELADLQTPLYRLDDVGRARQRARSAAVGSRECADWEQGYYHHRAELRDLVLPANAFLAIDRISDAGRIVPGHRPTLGRFAKRQGPRPCLVAPQKGGLTEHASGVLEGLDALIVNAQGLRGRRALASTRLAIQARGSHRAGLIVAASPTDLFTLDTPEVVTRAAVTAVGDPPTLSSVALTEVGRDRPTAEREFQFSVEGLRDQSRSLNRLLDLAIAAWWAVRQSLDGGDEPEVYRFRQHLERYATDHPAEAAELQGASDLLRTATLDTPRTAERRDAVASAVLDAKGARDILVLCRSGSSAKALRDELASRLGVDTADLRLLGVLVQTERELLPSNPPDLAVAAGYSGRHTVDQLLASRAKTLHVVLDPIEARVCWCGVHDAARVLLDVTGTLPKCLPDIADRVATVVPTVADAVSLTTALGSLEAPQSDWRVGISDRLPPVKGEAAILFTDGTRLDVSLNARFDVLGPNGARLRSLNARDLQSGDEAIVLREDARAVFSDQLLAAIDQGPLQRLAAQREVWFTVVQAMEAAGKVHLRDVTARMQAAGASVDYSTVRSWVKGESAGDVAMPQRQDRFLAFASALGVTLPQHQLIELFGAIRRLRVLHRKVGRDLARAIRAAYVNRLDVPTLARIERDWGLSTRELVEAARVATVDDVLLPEGIENGTHE